MEKEAQPLSFEEIKQGSPENSSSYRKLTPEALQQIQEHLGKPVEVTFEKESWIYMGPYEEEDHSTGNTRVSGILTHVDERTIGIQVHSGKTVYDDGSATEHKESYMEFPFYQDRYALRSSADISHLSLFGIEGQTFQLERNAMNAEKMEGVMKSIQKISGIISSYGRQRIRPDITDVTAALKHLSTEEFHLLYVKLRELADSPLAEVRFDPLAEIMYAAENDRLFGQRS
ncbi:hypothetical protein KKG44_02460, partial [Patescibacteria group bacterium]|nr:hypothetical protein [Patescibacteria group bacterium]